MIRLKSSVLAVLIAVSFVSCSYKQHLMFAVPDQHSIDETFRKAETNYVIQKNDLLELNVHTNAGEKIIDPSIETPQTTPGTQATTVQYLVDAEGYVKFPLIPKIKTEGLTIQQAEAILEKEYEVYYKQPFVKLRFANKRVVVLGAPGGQVIPLTNENMRLTEVLALAKGINTDAKSNNIRILRGNQYFLSDLSTFSAYQTNNIILEPNDIIYVEPVVRPFREAVREYGPIFSIVTSLATLVVIITNSNNE